MVLQAIFNDAFFSTTGSSSTTLFIGSSASTLVAVDSCHHRFPSLLFLVCGKDRRWGCNRLWSCNFCEKVVKSSHSRVKAHLLKICGSGIATCLKVTDAYLVDLRRVYEEDENKLKSKNVPLPTDKRTPTPLTLPPKRRKTSNIESAFNIEDMNHLRAEIARMFYSTSLSFHLARNPYFVSSYSFAANCNLSGFLPPSYNALRTSLLQQERSHIERLLQPIKSLWSLKGVTLVADGWTDAQRRPLINFMAISEEGPMFLKAIDGSKEYKDKHYMFDLLKDVIKEKLNFLIFWTPCVVHALNLGVKNICAAKNVDGNENVFNKCGLIAEVIGDASFIKVFIMTHSMRLAIFNEFSSLKLLSIAETRFASMIVMLKRLKLLKRCLQNMVISDHWNSYREDDVRKAAHVKELILNDIWWDKVDYILSFMDPIYSMIRICDTDASNLHLVYEMWDSMIEKVKTTIYRHDEVLENEVSSFFKVIHEILNSRWSKSCNPLHCLAHSLNPRYYSDNWLNKVPNRVPPHRDDELSSQRIKCLKRYFPHVNVRTKVYEEFSKFSSCAGDFGSFDSIEDRWALDPKTWWVMHGSSTPILQKLALKLLVQPCSSSCCERNWSTYSIHYLKRNKMDPKRAEDLVFVHSNLRLLSRKKEGYKKGETRLWDINGDVHDPLDDSAGVLEMEDLSLDEPDLEAMLFLDDGNGGEENETIRV
ncbi:hypothetical protein JHK82_025010 [Glycine max]|uniref:BED-type domain-containing protein n=1 Tax=Glycine max TaxID=3847 RepID=A0A0R0IF54_SOYBN|nr:hypothetical protein JHK87_024950 [Glycine soja]KAG5007084.1 hypothetical protein JHK85_025626 [Glycine max]KAG5012869.1 hypothetical protein JHK86_025130 [Glycine max]KAG5133822.1 hypothetical protein JHK82_025010 [Glycine max]KAH1042848.1 hypothetical protein GYH30_024941 [Glycine max]